MKLSRYYRNAVLFPAAIMLMILLIYAIIDNHEYVSEWFTAEGVILISFIYAIIFSVIICILSLTIFLNNYAAVRQSIILNFFSWFLLPIGLIVIMWIHDIKHCIQYNVDYLDTYISNFILTVPFLLGLILSYIKYRKNNYRQQRV
jgi:hypothetical protein